MKMKSISFFVFSLFICTMVKAQINMTDSTVQVVAYWEIGDKHKYKYIQEDYTVENNDTVYGNKTYELFTLEVVDSTAAGYVVEYKTIETKHEFKKKEDQEMIDALSEISKGFAVRLSTNENGTLQDIVNWDECLEVLNKGFETLRPKIRNAFGENLLATSDSIEIDRMINGLCASLSNKETMLAGMNYITQLFYAHGARMNIDQEYDSSEKRYTYLSNTIPVDATTNLWVDEIEEENDYAYINTRTTYNSDQLVAVYLDYMNKLLGKTDSPDKFQDNPERPYLFMDEVFNLAVQVGFGWTTNTYYRLKSCQGKKETIKSWQVDMVFE